MKTLLRRIKHLIKSGCIMIGIEHFLVMFPSAMLIAKLAITSQGPIVELPTILLFCGVGTLIFVVLTRKKIPFFLGPCFAYIGFLSYHVGLVNSMNSIDAIRTIIYYGYFISGIMLLLLSILYRFNWFKNAFHTLLPDTVMGPAISLLGLALADTGVTDSGFNSNNILAKYLAVITIISIIVMSLLKHHFLQNASILIGVFIGCLLATLWGVAKWPPIFTKNSVILKIPNMYFLGLFSLPKNILRLSLTILPPTLIAFVEGIGRLTVYRGMLKRDNLSEVETFESIMLKQSASNVITSIAGITPDTIYAENMAIMNLHSAELATQQKGIDDPDVFVRNCYSSYTIYPYIIASVLCIIVALMGDLQKVLIAIPLSVFGGMELFVFGLITAPGIQILVEQQVDYKKVSNQIITSSVLLAGVSGLSFQKDSLVLQGMSLGLVVGATVNLITIILRKIGLLNEKIAAIDIVRIYLEIYQGDIHLFFSSPNDSKYDRKEKTSKWKEYMEDKTFTQRINKANSINMEMANKSKTMSIKQESGKIYLYLDLENNFKKQFENDHETIMMSPSTDMNTSIMISEKISHHTIRDLLTNIK